MTILHCVSLNEIYQIWCMLIKLELQNITRSRLPQATEGSKLLSESDIHHFCQALCVFHHLEHPENPKNLIRLKNSKTRILVFGPLKKPCYS